MYQHVVWRRADSLSFILIGTSCITQTVHVQEDVQLRDFQLPAILPTIALGSEQLMKMLSKTLLRWQQQQESAGEIL